MAPVAGVDDDDCAIRTDVVVGRSRHRRSSALLIQHEAAVEVDIDAITLGALVTRAHVEQLGSDPGVGEPLQVEAADVKSFFNQRTFSFEAITLLRQSRRLRSATPGCAAST